MTDLHKAAEMALEAMKDTHRFVRHYVVGKETERIATAFEDAMKALRQALAQPEQGEVVVVKNSQGQIVAVTRQDGDGRILKTIATSAQPEQEPVAWQTFNEWMHKELPAGTIIGDTGWWASRIYKKFLRTALVSKPWVSLTDNEIINTANEAPFEQMVKADDYIYIIARNIEAKLKEKNG